MTVIPVERGTHTDFYRQLPDLTMEHLGTLNDKTLAEGLLRLLNEPISTTAPFQLERPAAQQAARRRGRPRGSGRGHTRRSQADWDKMIVRAFDDHETMSTREIIDALKPRVRQSMNEQTIRNAVLNSQVLVRFGSIPSLPHLLGTSDGIGARNHYIWKLK